jgi:parallel beta-helix repeat protein
VILSGASQEGAAMPSYLTAFMSHAHADNALTDPYADALNRLGVPLYYDRANPQTGHFLGDALQEELERRKTLVVMVTPAALASFWVRLEINTFLGLMASDPARKLIPVRVAQCQLPAVLNGMWWVDALGRTVADVMSDLTRALEAAPSASPAANGAHGEADGYSCVVDWRRGMGDHTTIIAAIAAAQPGERILVRKGLYEGGLTIDKPLELVGDGLPGDVEVTASGTHAITFTASQGRVANITLRQTGGGDGFCGVNITAGRLELEGCDISSQSNACIAIHDGASPIVRRNRIHDGLQSGVFAYDNGLGLLENNDIFGHTLAGVEIKAGAAPTLRHNRIYDGKSSGVMVGDHGQGRLEDNDIYANALSGVSIKLAGTPTLRRNLIHDNRENGVFVYEEGHGLLEDNDIVGNLYAGAEIREKGSPTMRNNRIHKNGYQAIWVYDQGGGVFESNDLRENAKGAWSIADDSKASVTRSGNTE